MRNTAIFCHHDPSVPQEEHWYYFHFFGMQKKSRKLSWSQIPSLAQRTRVRCKKLSIVPITQSWYWIQNWNPFFAKNAIFGVLQEIIYSMNKNPTIYFEKFRAWFKYWTIQMSLFHVLNILKIILKFCSPRGTVGGKRLNPRFVFRRT